MSCAMPSNKLVTNQLLRRRYNNHFKNLALPVPCLLYNMIWLRRRRQIVHPKLRTTVFASEFNSL